MRAAALDLGSNTLRLLVADVEPAAWRSVERGLATPRLGRGLNEGGSLAPEAQEAARRAAGGFVARARELGARRVALGASEACRRAKGGAAFVASLAAELGLERAEVLSPQREARLSRLGVLSRLAGPLAGALLADVGGGSTELVPLGQGSDRPLSLPLGAVSLSEAYLAGDPPLPAALAALARAVDEGLAAAGALKASRLVATAGTAATLASLCLGLDSYSPGRIDNLRVTAGELQALFTSLAAMPLSARELVKGMEPGRADIILAGLAVLAGLLARLGLKELTTMNAGLLEGILLADLGYSQSNLPRGSES